MGGLKWGCQWKETKIPIYIELRFATREGEEAGRGRRKRGIKHI
jgi:hypothetical protein